LQGNFSQTSREAFRVAHDVSAYSLIALARQAAPLMSAGGSIVAMTYYGAEKVMPNYNVMGVAKASLEATARYLAADLGAQNIRVNCISAGPTNTTAARGIGRFGDMLGHVRDRAPLDWTGKAEDLAGTGLYLASEMSAKMTGQVLYVDGGYEILGM
jgi:enoyl-[acyl-carrier protein] reductase I